MTWATKFFFGEKNTVLFVFETRLYWNDTYEFEFEIHELKDICESIERMRLEEEQNVR